MASRAARSLSEAPTLLADSPLSARKLGQDLIHRLFRQGLEFVTRLLKVNIGLRPASPQKHLLLRIDEIDNQGAFGCFSGVIRILKAR